MNVDYGAYGVLRFLKKGSDDIVVASYPIDDDTLTFGKGADCNIRLYYPSVSPLHAKLVFKERKGFLMVYGSYGVHVDGCIILPSSSSGEMVVPLTNDTILEISKKRFRFEYPPKPYRAALAAQINTPSASHSQRRTLRRLSLIRSTEVFESRPDPDPRVNLHILQSPLRRSPLKNSSQFNSDEEEDPIVLVESNHPRVSETDNDLLILEDVPRPESIAKTPVKAALPVIPRQQQQFTTPRRRAPRNSLHRAVLIRSAQKAVYHKKAREEEEERELDAVEMIVEEGPTHEEEADHPEDVAEDIEEHAEEDENEAVDEAQGERGRSAGVLGWRHGLEAVRSGLRALSRSVSPEKEPEPTLARHAEPISDIEENGDDEQEASAPLVSEIVSASRHAAFRRPSGELSSLLRPVKPSRESISLADRVQGSGRVSSGPRLSLVSLQGNQIQTSQQESQGSSRHLQERSPAKTASRRVSNEERQAILERRRQSLATPDAFWSKNGTPGSRLHARPGLYPSASEPTRIAAPNFGMPLSIPTSHVAHPPTPPGLTSFDEFMTPSRAWATSRGAQEPAITAEADQEPDEMLRRIKSTIGAMKRRQSIRTEEEDARLRALGERREDKELGMDVDTDADEDVDSDEEVVPKNASASSSKIDSSARHEPEHSPPREPTPEIEDLRHVFARPQPTARISGVRNLFQIGDSEARARDVSTPALDGVAEMFSQPLPGRTEGREDFIPSSDEEEARMEAKGRDAEPERKSVRTGALRKTHSTAAATTAITAARASTTLKTVPLRKTVSESRAMVRPSFSSGRSTPNDEATSDSVAGPLLTRTRARTATAPKTGPVLRNGSQQPIRPSAETAKAVERAPRARKIVEKDAEVPPVVTKAPAKKPAARTAKPALPARATAPSRSKKTIAEVFDPDEVSQDEEEDVAPVAARVRQRHAATSSQQDDSDEKPHATRRAPARATITTTAVQKPAPAVTRKAPSRKAVPEKENTPDTEDEDNEPVPPLPLVPPLRTTRRAAVRKGDAVGQSEPERETQAKVRAPRTRAATRG